MDEEAPGPGLEALRLAERVELVARQQLHESRLDGVLEVVLELGVAPAPEADPVLAELLEDALQARIRSAAMGSAQDAQYGFRSPAQHANRLGSH